MFIRKMQKGGRIYYQVAESYRENGKVKTRIIKHLGPIQNLIENNPGSIDSNKIYLEGGTNVEYGGSFSLNEICNNLKLEGHIDKFIKKQPEVLNLGKAIKLASIHRCLRPKGFSDISNWFNYSMLKFTEKILPQFLSKQNFNIWLNNFDEETVDNIQTSLSHSIFDKYKLDLSRIIIDFTNVDTYQRIRDEEIQLAKKGKPKSNKKSTLQINYALVCSNDGIPLHHTIYEGNINDPEYFKIFSKSVLQKYGKIFKQKESLVIVFDRGMNSEESVLNINKDYKFVGSVKRNECKDVCTDIGKYQLVRNDKEGNVIKCYEFNITKFGQKFRGIASYHERTAKLIKRQYEDKIKKVKKELNVIKQKLNKPKWTEKDVVVKRIENLLKKYKIKDLFDIEIEKKESKLILNKLKINKKQYEKIKESWGISFLYTNLKKTIAKEIIDIYFREKDTVEVCNKMLKQVDFCRVGPVRCWIDEHIRAHFLRCTIALTIGKLLAKIINKQLKQNWIPSTIIDNLKRLSITITTIKPFNKKDSILANYDSDSKILFDSLNLKESFKKIKKIFI